MEHAQIRAESRQKGSKNSMKISALFLPCFCPAFVVLLPCAHAFALLFAAKDRILEAKVASRLRQLGRKKEVRGMLEKDLWSPKSGRMRLGFGS